jgi:methionine synthase I (cobalamin-dependent)
VNVDDWEFANTEQTELLVDGGEARLQIETITDTQLVIVETVDASQDLDNEDEDELPIKWYFTKVN